jgi:hypothetical protein
MFHRSLSKSVKSQGLGSNSGATEERKDSFASTLRELGAASFRRHQAQRVAQPDTGSLRSFTGGPSFPEKSEHVLNMFRN